VRQATPGDEAELEVREDHRSYAFADITRLLEAGPSRRTPPCEYLPRCGGCPWQHVAYTAQLDAKQRAVDDLLLRIGRLDAPHVLPIIAAREEYGYRRRLSLRVENDRVGYFAAATHDLVAVEHCLLAAPELEGALPLVQRWIETLATRINRVEVAADGQDGGLVFAAQAEGGLSEADAGASESFLAAHARVRGMMLRGRGWRRSWGEPRLRVALHGGESIAVHAGGFTQVNAAANEVLVATALDFAACAAGDRVADLYAGFGNITFPLARRAAEVIAVERDAESARDGEAHARAHGYDAVRFVAAGVPAVLSSWVKERRRVDIAVLDPPRSGAAGATSALVALAPRRVVYVSCNPSTLARDLALLAPRYRIGRIQPIDFFPQTYHVETVVELVLTDR